MLNVKSSTLNSSNFFDVSSHDERKLFMTKAPRVPKQFFHGQKN